MPVYHFNVRTQSHIADTLTVEREGHLGLRLELAKFVGEMLKDHAGEIWSDQDWQIDVSDEDGLILYAMQISAMKTAATAHEKTLPPPRAS